MGRADPEPQQERPFTREEKVDNFVTLISTNCDAERGWRAQIARAFGVPPKLVSDWFAKRKTPTRKQELPIQLFVERELHGKGQ
jgi:hypothetical protein